MLYIEMSPIIKLTSTELIIYRYLLDNPSQVKKYNIRELAIKINASTSSIVRCLKKLGYSGFSDYKQKIISESKRDNDFKKTSSLLVQARDFFNKRLDTIYSKKIKKTGFLLKNAEEIFFFGIGTSGILANYGARQFSNFGLNAKFIDDPFYPLTALKNNSNIRVAIVLSVSGETKESLQMTRDLKNSKAKITSITNHEYNSLSRLSDVNFNYDFPDQILGRDLNLTSQLPVIYILESIIRETKKESQ
ncbi:MurR/RpiR family transcriptional regulator [Oenococcus alcoholitolerans]|uniref:MurR/RpiR family transcriptional regulator n=1 Tax=Oenococcus alcoholitolerans TaxID=931074 RepID=UPI003F725B2B